MGLPGPVFLRDDVTLEAGAEGALLSRRGSPVVHRLDVGETLTLALCGQLGDAEAVVDHLATLADVESARSRATGVFERWGVYLGDGSPRPLSSARLRALAMSGSGAIRRHREAAPAAISWLVTLTCNRRCPYCYYQVLPWDADGIGGPADAVFSWPNVARMIDEMALIGTSTLYLTGGEPLLRPDLVRVIGHASRQGIRVFLNSKYAIDAPLAEALATAGLFEISYSLDAAEAKVADALAGHRGYLGEAVTAISASLKAGLRLRVNAVATSPSATRLQDLAELCQSLGVPRLTISPYMEPSFARSAHVKLIRLGPPLAEIVDDIRARVGPGIELDVGSAEAAASSTWIDCSDRLFCEVGIQTLDVLPDGRCTRCRYAPNDEELVVGDLRSQSLLETWNGAPLRDLTYPGSEAFGDTSCGTCGALERCNSRGRCVVGAKLAHNRIHAPDAACEWQRA